MLEVLATASVLIDHLAIDTGLPRDRVADMFVAAVMSFMAKATLGDIDTYISAMEEIADTAEDYQRAYEGTRTEV